MLQTRNGKRTAAAALKIAVDLVDEGMITERRGRDARGAQAAGFPAAPHVRRQGAEGRQAHRHRASPLPRALPAARSCSPLRTPPKWAEKGHKVVLVRLETSPEDIEGMVASQGILTVRGGMTSHAAVVARGMGTCCVSGCSEIKMREGSFELGGKTYTEGDWISLDGSTGKIYGEAHPHRGSHHLRRLRPLHGLGRRGAQTDRPHQRRQPARRGAGRQVWRGGHRPVPHRAHVL